MLSCVAVSISRRGVAAALCVSSVLGVLVSTTSVQAQSDVYATICVASSSVTITQPVDDSTVTSGDIVISGTVDQANQIEVYIDDVFDNAIPLTIGQTQYSSTVQLSPGTHTLRVEAVDSCGGQNAEASSVVTYTVPPSQPSQGGSTPTSVAQAQGAATVTIGGGPPVSSEQDGREARKSFFNLPAVILQPLERFAAWLGITEPDYEGHTSRLSLPRAIAITVSMFLLVFGVVPMRALRALAESRLLRTVLPHGSAAYRRYFVAWSVRIVALLLLLAMLFL